MEDKFFLPEGVMHVENEGQHGERVVLIHGTAAYHFCWRHVTRDLSKNFRVFVPDLNGYRKGMSKPPKKKFSSRMMDMPIEMLTDELLAEWRKPFTDPNTPYVIASVLKSFRNR